MRGTHDTLPVMASVGERLKLLRESRNTTIEEMVVATGIGQSYLEAVENDQIHVLPGKAFGKLYIRAYAEVFGFDPQPWIDDYDREQRLAGGPSTEPSSPVPAGARPVSAAIARWKESKAAAAGVEPIVEHVADGKTATDAVGENERERIENVATVDRVDTIEPVAPEPVATPEEPVAPTAHGTPKSVRVRSEKRSIAAFVLIGAVVVASAIYFVMRGTSGDERAQPTAAETPSPALPPPVAAEPPAAPPAKAQAVRETPVVRDVVGSELTVPEFGVGRRIINARLDGERSEFAAGEVACFQTRVVGGKRGETIRHVWIYDGRAQQSITLRLGGPDWRTNTKKTLYKTGPWTVEARDGKGRVLATASLTCVPAGR